LPDRVIRWLSSKIYVEDENKEDDKEQRGEEQKRPYLVQQQGGRQWQQERGRSKCVQFPDAEIWPQKTVNADGGGTRKRQQPQRSTRKEMRFQMGGGNT
jgi:hypothetical protein